MIEQNCTHTATDARVVTQNACNLCAPLGAALAFKGVQGAVPLLHGSQGCATYMRRYLISHFKEPVDIASSNFSEATAVFGGRSNLQTALDNVRRQYAPELIGIATTCLSETIGDDVPHIIRDYVNGQNGGTQPEIVAVSTPSYSGTHIDGFHAAIRALVETLARRKQGAGTHVNLFPGLLSPADLRYLKRLLIDFEVENIILPDYSQTLDGPTWTDYQRLPAGGTPVAAIEAMGDARASLEFGRVLANEISAGKHLHDRCGVPCYRLGLPIGVSETDRLVAALEEITGRSCPAQLTEARGRLIDAYVDGHKYVFEARAVVYGEEDLVVGLASFLCEIGVMPVLCASGGKSGQLTTVIRDAIPDFDRLKIEVLDGVDFMDIQTAAAKLKPDFLIGSSKGYPVARELDCPLIRVGFPIHDRVGGARLLHVGYAGAQQLFDRIVNGLLEKRQATSDVGYAYL
jgi:nitrogenase molybdenum-iron protein NifN